MKRSIAYSAAALLLCLVASGASARMLPPRDAAPARVLKGIEVAGAAAPATAPVEPRGIFDWIDAGIDELLGQCTWGNCCGSACDCSANSAAIDQLDEACRTHDVCYGGDDWTNCAAVCRCDGELAAKADEYADMDCSTSGYAGCEDMKDKASPIAASMKAKLLACRC